MKFALYVLAFVSIVLCGCESPPDSSPNIIFILADDLGYGDTGPYGQTMIKTPNIDKMAKEGMVFTQFYAGSTVCAPSRSALMTGLHTGHTRVRGNALVPLQAGDTTVAELLKARGYRTGLVGKWGLGEAGSSGIPNKKGFDYFYGYLNQVHAHNHYPDYLWENETVDSLDNVVEYVPTSLGRSVGGVSSVKKEYASDKFMEKAQAFLDGSKSNPFFLYLAFTLPHANNEASYWKESGMEVPEVGEYYVQSWPDPYQQHAAMITYLDKCVGKVMARVRELGLEENTLIIFSSDNGPHDEGLADHTFFNSNGPLRGRKRDMYEGGIRVPFIARWPGKIEAGVKNENAFAFWDVLPTFCELAGIDPPTTDGISFMPSLTGEGSQEKHDYLYWEFFEEGGKQAVKMDNWKYVKLDVNSAEGPTHELFDLSLDLGEDKNVADQYPEIVLKGEEVLRKAHRYSAEFHFSNELPE